MKRYLADTHAILWFGSNQWRRLGPAARRAFSGAQAGACEIAVSVVTLWEVAMLHDEGSIHLPAGFSAWCDALEATRGMRVEPLLRADIEEARSLASLRDPHDRLIAGTALRIGVPLLTADARMRAEVRLRTVW